MIMRYQPIGSTIKIKNRGTLHFVIAKGGEKIGQTIKGLERNALIGKIQAGEKIGILIQKYSYGIRCKGTRETSYRSN